MTEPAPVAILPPVPPPLRQPESGDDRYFPTPEETEILVLHLRLYFRFPKRSAERKNQILQAREQLDPVHPGHWNERNIRVWFTNNQRTYVDESDANPEFLRKPVTAARPAAPATPPALPALSIPLSGGAFAPPAPPTIPPAPLPMRNIPPSYLHPPSLPLRTES
jgi:hypothetical protein